MGGDQGRPAPRNPGVEDLKRLCAALNAAGARYMLIGGLAVNYYGFARASEDIDFLVDSSPDNMRRLKAALGTLEDGAALELGDEDLLQYAVVRVVDEVTVDLLARVGDVTFANAEAVDAVVDGIPVPVAALPTLIATKQGKRAKDQADLAFLVRLGESQ